MFSPDSSKTLVTGWAISLRTRWKSDRVLAENGMFNRRDCLWEIVSTYIKKKRKNENKTIKKKLSQKTEWNPIFLNVDSLLMVG